MAIFEQYSDEMVRILKRLNPQMTFYDLRNAIDYSIKKRYKEHKCVFDNNYTKQKLDTTLLAMANYIAEKEPICTAYGVLFKKHGEVPNPLIELIESFMDGRDENKAIMFKYLDQKNYEMFEKYNLFQLLNC